MNGQHMIFYKCPVTGAWTAMLRKTYGGKYSRPKDWLANAEKMMRGGDDVLWRKTDEFARRMIWC